MSFCKSCGTPLGDKKFCMNCGKERENPNTSVVDDVVKKTNKKKKGFTTLLAGGVAIAVIGISYFVLGEDSLNETEPMEEITVAAEEKEVASHAHDTVTDDKENPLLLYQDVDILKSLKDGSIMGSLHIGSTREELINKIGPAEVDYFREGESRMDYPDATYMFSPSNERVYSVLLLLDSEHTTDFQDIRDVLGDGNERVLVESGKDDSDSYYLSYGTEDPLMTFYSVTEIGQPIYKVVYSNISVYSGDLSAGQKETLKHPGDIEPIILQIRKEYDAINNQLSSMRIEETGKSKTTYFNDQGIGLKVVEKTAEGSVEYYYDQNNDLFFIFQNKGSVEHRFYFVGNQMIRWINPSKVTIDYDAGQSNREYKEWETLWLELAY